MVSPSSSPSSTVAGQRARRVTPTPVKPRGPRPSLVLGETALLLDQSTNSSATDLNAELGLRLSTMSLSPITSPLPSGFFSAVCDELQSVPDHPFYVPRPKLSPEEFKTTDSSPRPPLVVETRRGNRHEKYLAHLQLKTPGPLEKTFVVDPEYLNEMNSQSKTSFLSPLKLFSEFSRRHSASSPVSPSPLPPVPAVNPGLIEDKENEDSDGTDDEALTPPVPSSSIQRPLPQPPARRRALPSV